MNNLYNFTKHELITLVQPPGTQQAVVNQPTIATTEQPRQAATFLISKTFPEEHSFGGKQNVYDSQSELFIAEIEKLKLEIEYIKLLTKKVSSEIEILELKKKSLSANCTALFIRKTVAQVLSEKRNLDLF